MLLWLLQAVDIGEVQRIQLSCKGGGLTAAWHLDRVTITHPLTGAVTDFSYKGWFSKEQGWTQVRGVGAIETSCWAANGSVAMCSVLVMCCLTPMCSLEILISVSQ